MATLIFSNEELDDIIKIVKSLQETGLLIKDFSQTIKNESKEQKRGFLGTLLNTLAASLLDSVLADKVVKKQVKKQIEQVRFLMPSHFLTNFEIQK